MRNKFDEQLALLNIELIKMGALCEDVILYSTKYLLTGNSELEEKVFSTDKEIDQMERDIEALCIKLLLQQQPVAKDLRMVSAAMKMISDMERIGDQASDITEIVRYTKGSEIASRIHIDQMSMATSKMVTDSINSYVDKNLELAKNVIEADDVVDDFFCKIKNELVNVILKKPDLGELCVDFLMIAKYYERIGDHATNIAEWVEFSMTGMYKGEYL